MAGVMEQSTFAGSQSGARVLWFLHTDDFSQDLTRADTPEERSYRRQGQKHFGTVAVFEHLYDSSWLRRNPSS